jgi:hypothetical protein
MCEYMYCLQINLFNNKFRKTTLVDVQLEFRSNFRRRNNMVLAPWKVNSKVANFQVQILTFHELESYQLSSSRKVGIWT